MVAANAGSGKGVTSFKPLEYIFPDATPFKTYALKTSELHPTANIPVADEAIEKQLRAAAEQIFKSFKQ